jgi:hypothetical protein
MDNTTTPTKRPQAPDPLDEINRLLTHAELATGVIQDANNGTRDDLKNPKQSINNQAAFIYTALRKIHAYVNRDRQQLDNVYIPGHYAGD